MHLAFHATHGRDPLVVFLPGLRSDMQGAKALHVADWCRSRGVASLRLDYSGHGASADRFEDGTIGRWRDDALAVIDRQEARRLVLVGSSMGGWIALLIALARPETVAGVLGLAAAPDFTERLMWDAMTPEERGRLMAEGVLQVPSEYGDPLPVTRALIEDGRRHLLLDAAIPLACPLRLIQGQADPDVPWETALRIAARATGGDVQVALVKDGDHRLSRPADLALITATLGALLGEDGA